LNNTIDSFTGNNRFLSNFFPEPKRERLTNEHFYQAAKTLDKDQQHWVMACATAGEAKKRGQLVDMRPDWESVKVSAMLLNLRTKFYLDPLLSEALVLTGDAWLVEGNHWGDTYWGVCNGVGENMLGQLLMTVREEVRWRHLDFG
jgi:ribA/ribD-fused uncharacterized protein